MNTSRQAWSPVMGWRYLFSSVGVGMLAGGLSLLVPPGAEDGYAIAYGIATGLGVWIGYPLATRSILLLLRPLVRLSATTTQRIDELVDEFQIPESDDVGRPSALVRLIGPALSVYTFSVGTFVLLTVSAGFKMVAGVNPDWLAVAICGVPGAASYTYVFLVLTLWVRGRLEVSAYVLRSARRPQKVVAGLNRWFRLA